MKKVLALSILLVLGGCLGQGQGPNQTFGTIGGAALGGFFGSQIGGGSGNLAATAAGTLLGAALGNSWGQTMDTVNNGGYRAPAPVYVAPQAPAYYAPPPVVYYTPPPVYYMPSPAPPTMFFYYQSGPRHSHRGGGYRRW